MTIAALCALLIFALILVVILDTEVHRLRDDLGKHLLRIGEVQAEARALREETWRLHCETAPGLSDRQAAARVSAQVRADLTWMVEHDAEVHRLPEVDQ